VVKTARLGQNFLTDKNVIHKIAGYFNPKPEDVVLEIGAGRGALTRIVAPQVANFFAVEIDTALIGELEKIPNITVIHKDFLEVDLASINPGKTIRILGNLPYYISTAILTRLIRQKDVIEDLVLMFQEEVAQRILAQPSGSEYSVLSVMSQYYCEINKGFRVSKNCFKPMPEIESRVMNFRFKPDVKIDVGEYISFLQKAFSQRRKKLRNNLLRELNLDSNRLDQIFLEMSIPENIRAENLTPLQFEQLIYHIDTKT
jgi:16S rRNA (adenine1518-N6/adenine1519-N6)-dimethyltransferase